MSKATEAGRTTTMVRPILLGVVCLVLVVMVKTASGVEPRNGTDWAGSSSCKQLKCNGKHLENPGNRVGSKTMEHKITVNYTTKYIPWDKPTMVGPNTVMQKYMFFVT